MGRDKKKEKYRMIPILLFMKCIRPILKELIIDYAKAKTRHGEKQWTVDDFLGHYRKQIEKKVQTFYDYENYISVLYPSDGRSDFGKWDLKLMIFILKNVCALGSDFKYYIGDILNIRDQLCVPHNPGITRVVCKEYKRRLKSARSHFYRLLHKLSHSDDLKKTIERRAHNIKNEMKNTSDVKYILTRWEELEKDRVPNGCGKTGVQKYLTLNILLSETCCEVMQGLIRKKVKEKRHRSIDIFLWEHEKRIRRRIGTLDGFGRAEDMLLPLNGQKANMLEWDVTLLCWVLLNVCFLGEDLADAIGSIRRVRNEMIHKSSMNVSDLEYQKYFEDITKSIDTCLLYLGDADFSEDIHNKIEEIDRSGVEKDETIRRLQMCQSDRVNHELQNKHLRGQAAIIGELSQILKTISGLELPACTLEVMLQNCSEECEKELSNMLVEKINQVIGKDTIPENRGDELTTAIKDFVDRYKGKGWKPLCAENGSVLFETKCYSFSSLCELYDTHRDEGSTSFVSAVEDAVQHMLGRRVHLRVVMHNAEMDKCMTAIVSSLYNRIKELEVKVRGVKTASKGSINIWMASNGEECSHDTSGNDGKDLAQRLTNIADILQKRYQTPNLTVTATLHDFSENSCENVIEKEETSCDFSGKEESISDIDEKMNTEVIYDLSEDSCGNLIDEEETICDVSGKEEAISDINEEMNTEVLCDFSEDSCGNLIDNEETICDVSGKEESISDINEKMNTEVLCDNPCPYSDGEDGMLCDFPGKERAMFNKYQTTKRSGISVTNSKTEELFDVYPENSENEAEVKLCDQRHTLTSVKDAIDMYAMQELDLTGRDQFDLENLRMDLISFYRQQYLHICLSPLPCDETANIDALFVPLNIEKQFLHSKSRLRNQSQCSDISEVIQVTNYYDIFYSNGHPAEKIYVTGAAGFGKTTFCKKLVSDWCKSWHLESLVSTSSKHEIESQIHLKNHENPLLKFDLVFLVLLRETKDTTLEAMICNQLGISKERLADCFLNCECLIILDGLDEWTPSNRSETQKIPLLQLQNKCTTLVTSREYLLDQVRADLNENVCEIAIKGIGSNSQTLIRSIFQSISKGKRSSRRYDIYAKQFLNEVKTRNIEGLLSNPNVLKILLKLWLQKGKLDQSLSELYEKISRMLIKNACLMDSHGNDAAANISLSPAKCAISCTEGSSFMLSLLQSLAKLAYFNLVSEYGNITPFQHFQALENDLISSERDILLCSGILSQNVRFSYHNLSRYVFVHKSFQEYFAAAYIASNSKKCMRQITDAYMSLEKGFKMANVFLFLSSMKPDAMESVYYHIGKLTDCDEKKQIYRLLCANGKLVEHDHVLLVSPLDGLVVNTFYETPFLLYNKHKIMKLWIDAVKSTPNLLHIRPQLVKVIDTDFDDMLSIPTKKIPTPLQGIEEMILESVEGQCDNCLHNFERWLFTFSIPEENLEQPFTSAPNRKNVIILLCCCHADEKGKSQICKHGLKTEPSLYRVIQTAYTRICREKVNFSNIKKQILEFCL